MNTLSHSFTYDEDNDQIRQYLEKVIKTSRLKLDNKIKDEDIDFDIYEVVTSMLGSDKPYLINYLKEVDIENLTREDLISFNNIITTVVSELNNDY